jgi:hypothetical protein
MILARAAAGRSISDATGSKAIFIKVSLVNARRNPNDFRWDVFALRILRRSGFETIYPRTLQACLLSHT